MWLVPVPYYFCLKGHGFIPYCAYWLQFSGILRLKGMCSVCFHQQEIFSFERLSWSYIRSSLLQHFCCSVFGVKDKHGSSWLKSGLLLLTLRRARADSRSREVPVFSWSWLREEKTLGRRSGKSQERVVCYQILKEQVFEKKEKLCQIEWRGQVEWGADCVISLPTLFSTMVQKSFHGRWYLRKW